MADEEENNEKGESSASLAGVQSQAKTNRLMLIGVSVLCAVLVCAMATGLMVMFSRIDVLAQAAATDTEDPMEEQFVGLEKQLLALSEFRKKELKQIVAYTDQLNRVRADCSSEKIAPYTDFLMTREKDFQKLIDVIGEGTASLAGMNKGSRKWVAPHIKSLKELKQKSIDRKKTLASLTEGGSKAQ